MGTGIIIARKLGPERRGLYGLVFLAATMLFSFGHLGLGSAIAYYTGERKFSRKKIFAFTLVSSLTLGTVMGVLFFFAYPQIRGIWDEIPGPVMLTGIIAVPFLFLHMFVMRYLLASLKVLQSNITKIFEPLFFLVGVVVLVWIFEGGVQATVISFTASAVLASILGVLLYTRDSWPPEKFGSTLMKPMFSYGIKSYAILIFTVLNVKLDVFLVKYFLTASDVGFYQIAASIGARLWYLPNALGAMLFPTLLAMEKDSSKFSAKVCRNNLMIMLIISVAIVLAARPLVILLYGKEYEPVIYALYSIIWGVFIFPVYKFLAVDFAAKKKLGIGIFASFIGIIVNVLLNLYLIPRYGIVGAGIATSISYSVLSGILLIYFRLHTGIRINTILIPQKEDLATYRRGINSILRKMKIRRD